MKFHNDTRPTGWATVNGHDIKQFVGFSLAVMVCASCAREAWALGEAPELLRWLPEHAEGAETVMGRRLKAVEGLHVLLGHCGVAVSSGEPGIPADPATLSAAEVMAALRDDPFTGLRLYADGVGTPATA